MNAEEIRQKLKQANIDKDSIQENINKLEKQLAEAEKPKLRHGQIVETPSRKKYVAIEHSPRTDKLNIWGITSSGSGYINGVVETTNSYYRDTGKNIFDDLKRNAEDLREFDYKPYGSSEFHGEIYGKTILLKINIDCSICNIDEATKIHQKLGQLIATAKRKRNIK